MNAIHAADAKTKTANLFLVINFKFKSLTYNYSLFNDALFVSTCSVVPELVLMPEV